MENNDMKAHDFAGFWARFAAYVIDGAVIALFYNAMYWLAHQQVMHYLDSNPELARMLTKDVSEYSVNYKAADKIMTIYGGIMSLILNWCYFAGMESSPIRGTLGKWALGIYVTDLDGQRITFAQGTGRFFGKIISGIILGFGYIMAGTTDRKQALHDKMADCLVMRK